MSKSVSVGSCSACINDVHVVLNIRPRSNMYYLKVWRKCAHHRAGQIACRPIASQTHGQISVVQNSSSRIASVKQGQSVRFMTKCAT
jgi:hypothetical protein